VTDEQRLTIFQSVFKYMSALEELPEGTSLDMRDFIEPPIDKIVEDEVEQLKQKIRDFTGSAKVVSVADLCSIL
jgi:hypothetical protein